MASISNPARAHLNGLRDAQKVCALTKVDVECEVLVNFAITELLISEAFQSAPRKIREYFKWF